MKNGTFRCDRRGDHGQRNRSCRGRIRFRRDARRSVAGADRPSPRNDLEEPAARRRQGKDVGGGQRGDARADPDLDRPRSRLVVRRRRRGDPRKLRGEARGLREARLDREAGGDTRLQHVVDLDHRDSARRRTARERYRHALHESRAGDEARRGHPRNRHHRRDMADASRTSPSGWARRPSR